ncbi:MAG: NifU family protein [Rhodothermia bacterium]|nr:NifU family protein [Rhodothermia bacterium]
MNEQPDSQNDPTASAYDPASDPKLRDQIEEALDMLRPYLMADGGSVRLLNVTDDLVVELELLGACGTCPMSTMTLRAGIEQALKRTVPQITRVEAVNAPPVY